MRNPLTAFEDPAGEVKLLFHPFFLLSSLTPHPSSLTLAEYAKVVRQHLTPPDPVVVDVVAPDVEAVRDSLGIENGRKFAAAIRSLE